MAKTLLVTGTASHVGKSTVVTGLCRILAANGVSVAPFKAQNMSNNAHAVPVATGEGYGEIGVSQYVQAKAAGIAPTTAVNPVLLKPRGDGESELVIHGERVGSFSADSYYSEYWDTARSAAIDAFDHLAESYSVIVAEGAGGVSEINLHHRDLANRETAEFTDADIILVSDIDRGGAFASLVGSIELMPEDMRANLVGMVITKFRGDESILEPGITSLVERTGVPFLGVIPAEPINLPAEDSVSLPDERNEGTIGTHNRPAEETVTIGVLRFPFISNFTDFAPLGNMPGVHVKTLPLSASLESVDGVILPGTKNTVDDLGALRDAGMDHRLHSFTGPILGICGGYQMMGKKLHCIEVESTQQSGTIEGLGFLPVETTFSAEKHVEQTEYDITGVGPLAGATGTVTGFEIHLGSTALQSDVPQPIGPESAATEQSLGTYLHGLFENPTIREVFINNLFAGTERNRPQQETHSLSPIDAVAELVSEHVCLTQLGLPASLEHERAFSES